MWGQDPLRGDPIYGSVYQLTKGRVKIRGGWSFPISKSDFLESIDFVHFFSNLETGNLFSFPSWAHGVTHIMIDRGRLGDRWLRVLGRRHVFTEIREFPVGTLYTSRPVDFSQREPWSVAIWLDQGLRMYPCSPRRL
jgi:hypothetical protein